MGFLIACKQCRTLLGVVLVAALALASNAMGQTASTTAERIQNGLERSKLWCAHCHVVEPGSETAAQSDVPTFQSIAERPGQTVEKSENGILQPHPPMPDLQLSREEIRDLALYIMSLKP